MASFCNNCEADMVICQKCGRDVCSKEGQTKWIEGTGNVCKECGKELPFGGAPHWYPQPGNLGYDLMC